MNDLWFATLQETWRGLTRLAAVHSQSPNRHGVLQVQEVRHVHRVLKRNYTVVGLVDYNQVYSTKYTIDGGYIEKKHWGFPIISGSEKGLKFWRTASDI